LYLFTPLVNIAVLILAATSHDTDISTPLLTV
jgi:hypothetical protein